MKGCTEILHARIDNKVSIYYSNHTALAGNVLGCMVHCHVICQDVHCGLDVQAVVAEGVDERPEGAAGPSSPDGEWAKQ
jgi:hypothetical protein